MAQRVNRTQITSGLVVHYDTSNPKCFRGGPTSNLLNSTVNSFPSVGNAWGTFNTNQYNNNAYFSIGSITSISSSIVTTAANHPLRTYDVVRPQTTGGGVTAGTDYSVKKLSNTTFTLHAYDSNQDGTKGWTALDDLFNDNRVSINSSSFPTMWWGYPHLPNSGLVKTIVPNAFNGHDCIRLNYTRDVTDAMAYGGGTPTLVSGSTYTYSFYYRAADSGALGKTVNFSIHYYAAGYGADLGTTPALTTEWKRHTATATAPTGSTIALYWWPQQNGPWKMDVSEIQIESGSVATAFTPTNRGNTVALGGGLTDLSGFGSNATLVNSPIMGSDFGGSLILNGTNQYATISPTANTVRLYDATVVFAVRLPLYSGGQRCILSYRGGTGGGLYIGKNSGGIYAYYDQLNTPGYTVGSITDGRPVVVAVVLNSSANTLSTYINGSLAGSVTRTGWVSTYNSLVNLGYDAGGTNEYMTGSFYHYSHYNRVLSGTEIFGLYQSIRRRYGL